MNQVPASRVTRLFGDRSVGVDTSLVVPVDQHLIEEVARAGGFVFQIDAGSHELSDGDTNIVFERSLNTHVFVYPRAQYQGLTFAEQQKAVKDKGFSILDAVTVVGIAHLHRRAFWYGRVRTPCTTGKSRGGSAVHHTFGPCPKDVLRYEGLRGSYRGQDVGVLVGLTVPVQVPSRIAA